MTTQRVLRVSSPLILCTLAVLVVATACLVAFPGNMAVWQAASWTLVLALMGLCAFVPLSIYSLATRRVEKTWLRVASSVAGCVVLVAVVIGWLT